MAKKKKKPIKKQQNEKINGKELLIVALIDLVVGAMLLLIDKYIIG